jgi:hypothetical protein
MTPEQLQRFIAESKAKYERGWRPIDDPVVKLGNEFLEAIKARTVDDWSYDPDTELVRCDDGDRHRVWRLTGRHDGHSQEAVWPD